MSEPPAYEMATLEKWDGVVYDLSKHNTIYDSIYETIGEHRVGESSTEYDAFEDPVVRMENIYNSFREFDSPISFEKAVTSSSKKRRTLLLILVVIACIAAVLFITLPLVLHASSTGGVNLGISAGSVSQGEAVVYFILGRNQSSRPGNQTYKYANNTFTRIADTIGYHGFLSALVPYGNYIYALGGEIRDGEGSLCERLNIQTEQWELIQSVPLGPKASPISRQPVLYKDSLITVVLHAELDWSYPSNLAQFNFTTQSWAILASNVTTSLYGADMYMSGDIIYFYGNPEAVCYNPKFCQAVLSFNIVTQKWNFVAMQPPPGFAPLMWKANNTNYRYGGCSCGAPYYATSTLLAENLNTGNWTAVPTSPFPGALAYSAIITYDTYVWIIGGLQRCDQLPMSYLTDTYYYTPTTNTLRRGPSIPFRFYFGSAVLVFRI